MRTRRTGREGLTGHRPAGRRRTSRRILTSPRHVDEWSTGHSIHGTTRQHRRTHRPKGNQRSTNRHYRKRCTHRRADGYWCADGYRSTDGYGSTYRHRCADGYGSTYRHRCADGQRCANGQWCTNWHWCADG